MKNKKGFTLIELLAVIIILGVLLLVAIPGINKLLENSRVGAAKDNAKMVVKAIENCTLGNELSGGGVCDSKEAVQSYMESGKDSLDTYTINNGNITNLIIKTKNFFR